MAESDCLGKTRARTGTSRPHLPPIGGRGGPETRSETQHQPNTSAIVGNYREDLGKMRDMRNSSHITRQMSDIGEIEITMAQRVSLCRRRLEILCESQNGREINLRSQSQGGDNDDRQEVLSEVWGRNGEKSDKQPLNVGVYRVPPHRAT